MILKSVILVSALCCTFYNQTMQRPIHKSSGLPLDVSQFSLDDLQTLKPVLENIMARMDDWPQLNYYRNENERLIQALFIPRRVVFLGDSIFEYWKNPLVSNFFFSNSAYINRGIAGQTTPQILLRMRSDVIALTPRTMVLLAGVNDIAANTGPISLQETIGNIASIAELASAHGIRVIIGSLLPTSNYHFDGKDPRGPQTVKRPLAAICAINAWIKEYAWENNYIFIDYFSALVDDQGMLRKDLSDDDLHPNKAGYQIMEQLTQEVLLKIK